MICPYCEVEITMSQVDAEDGCCPECGTMLTASAIFMEQDPIEDELEEIDDLEDIDDI
jgi:transcription initiation factor IIE alpha subunit